MDIVTRKQLNVLIQLAEADKHFASVERDQIFEIAKRKNFPASDVRDLIRNPEPIESLGALSLDQKFEYLFSCIDLMLIDKRIFDTEIIFCQNVAIKLGFTKAVVEFLQHKIHKVPQEDLKKIVFANFT